MIINWVKKNFSDSCEQNMPADVKPIITAVDNAASDTYAENEASASSYIGETPAFKNILQFYKKNIHTKVNRFEYSSLKHWYNLMPADSICNTIKKAAVYNAPNINYINTILKNLKDLQLTTNEHVNEYKQQWLDENGDAIGL